jgi:hypothetical protein
MWEAQVCQREKEIHFQLTLNRWYGVITNGTSNGSIGFGPSFSNFSKHTCAPTE